MAFGFQMPYTDRFGTAHPASYWYCPQIVVSAKQGRASAVYEGYGTRAACDAGADSFHSHAVIAEGAEFAQLVADVYYGGVSLGVAIQSLAAADPFFAGAEVV